MAEIMKRITSITENDVLRERLSFELLERRKLLQEFIAVLRCGPGKSFSELGSADMQDIEVLNAEITALAISDLSLPENINELKEFVIKLLKEGCYKPERIKQDCTLLLSESKPDDFRDMLALGILTSQVNACDVVQLFSRNQKLFTMVHEKDAVRLILELEAELSAVDIYNITDILYDIAKKKSLSGFVHTRSNELVVRSFADFFVKLLGYEEFNYEKYLDDASSCLAKLEEVII